MSEWQPIDTAPAETEILMRADIDGREIMGRGRVSKREYDKPLSYEWHFAGIAPTHWKRIES
jgi:hypothetical protein